MKRELLVITGPPASGKTGLAYKIARGCGFEIKLEFNSDESPTVVFASAYGKDNAVVIIDELTVPDVKIFADLLLNEPIRVRLPLKEHATEMMPPKHIIFLSNDPAVVPELRKYNANIPHINLNIK